MVVESRTLVSRYIRRPLQEIKPVDADARRAWLVEHEGLTLAMVARRVIASPTMWRKAVRRELAAESPVDGVKGGHQSNESRKRFISSEAAESLIAETPDSEWRVIIALASYGGLRTPSETAAIRWGDIDWERWTIRVTCPKLAHHEHLAERIIPLFPEMRERLLTLFGDAEDGAEYVIARHRLGCANLRTHFERSIKRAGLKPWPSLFHNLRASRETELMREYDLATACKWIGNPSAIAAKHCATSVGLNSDFRRAAGSGPVEAQQKAQQSASGNVEPPMTTERADVQKPHKTRANSQREQFCSIAGETAGWAVQDSNQQR